MSRIVAVCPKEYPGVNAVLKHGAALGLWEHINLVTRVPQNDLLILGAWTPYYEEYLEYNNCVVYLTSTFGQMEFSQNQIEITNQGTIQRLLREERIKAVLSGWPDVAEFFAREFPDKSFYCPYPFSESLVTSNLVTLEKSLGKSIGIFLPYAPRKNTLNQILAASSSGLKVHTNLPFPALPNVHRINWPSNEILYGIISSVTMTLHCTFTESFCYSTAESIALGTIPIVSIQIAENLGLQDKLVCKQLDSVKTIRDKIYEVTAMSEDDYKETIEYQKFCLRDKLDKNIVLTKNVLDNLLKIVVK